MLFAWTALTLGFVGSFHCVGMCGPIALALPGNAAVRWRYVLGRIMYNLGRIMTYALLGVLFGSLGSAVRLAGLQEGLSIFAGVVILFTAVIPFKKGFTFGIPSAVSKVKSAMSALFKKRNFAGLFLIGTLNGLLPCGFVYMGIAGALTAGSIGESSLFMILFGLGTFPAMLAVSLGGAFAKPKARNIARKLYPVGAAVIAVLFILRGLALDIPYISPSLPDAPQTKVRCH
ncbi:MAG: sulfite exporter TauE/SafE family protein [Bacteroidota bacterium]